MKELSIEEKAKAYDKTLERAKSAIKECGNNKGRITMIEEIFPELKESDDERIRKDLCRAIWTYIPTEEGEEYLLWLEKQGEPQGKSAMEAINEEKVENANKVEKKFEVDDWILCNETLVKIVDCDNNRYTIETTEGLRWTSLIATVDRKFHLWTIQDAKDGDVLEWDLS